jgi:hypothetical protein
VAVKCHHSISDILIVTVLEVQVYSEVDLCLIRHHVVITFTGVEVEHHAFFNDTGGKSKQMNIPSTCASYCRKCIYLLTDAQNSPCSWDAWPSTVARLRCGRPRDRGSIQSKERLFLYSKYFNWSWDPSRLLTIGCGGGGTSPGIK